MKAIVVIIALLSIFTMIEARHRLAMPRNYLRNINKAIVNYCELKAHNVIQDDEIYSCFKNKMTTCNTLENFSKFDDIRSKCITDKGSDYGIGIILAIMIWVVVAICGSR
jgi:hypothetical protein